jgi:DNA-binding NarL/FixJ family response regulator
MLEGCSLKVIGAEFHASVSGVWQELNRTSRALGVESRLRGIALLLLAQLCYASKLDELITVPSYRMRDGQLAVLLPRVELELSRHFSPAVVEVCALALQGCSHAEIATRRGTSARTVANQLASAFRRLGVSGRLELLAAVARLQVRAHRGDGVRPAPAPSGPVC